ncbi:potassium transporter [Defluviimonas sp. 20V17]|uniref:Kef-type potassium/proton antiporter, CPA2 family n=1 Tax=Allgaiera indica TaxID=765699 RepID=A0AAN4UTU3_9RHOB|nr:cation:proton antiporter [Allgaiera indica]KDB05650.1 potassium transporter [Defluviimonas sp. 20V17]GHE04317.1 potassium transporter [Allgaiera indica]SDX39747.1 Kef-type potassium/proton antiporter, CPA2 family [Allgaiera indica]
MEAPLYLASLYLLSAVILVPLAVRMGLGSVLGFLAAGIVIGPVMGLTGHETGDLQHVAEFGVVMMLFLIGLELEPRVLWTMRHKLIGLGGLQILGTAAGVMAAGIALGLTWKMALAVGLILSLSSTAIVLQTLNERNLMRTNGGRSAFAVLLTQDIAVVPMLAFLPLLAYGISPEALLKMLGASNGTTGDHPANAVVSLVQGLPGWGVTLLTLAIVAAIVLGGHYLTRPVFRFVHAAHLPEISTAIALLIVLGIAFLMTLVGLSPALGTFLAGVVLANSEFRHQLSADIQPFKGLLMGLFFITVGAGIDFQVLAAEPLLILGLTLGVMALKLGVLLGLTPIFGIKGRDRWLFALSLAQAGEFGFLLVGFSVQQTVLPRPVGDILLLVIGLSMLLTPLLFVAQARIARRFSEKAGADQAADEIDEKGKVIIAGIGRFGQVVNRLVRMSGIQTVVLDADMAAVQLMRRFGVKGFYGDPTRPELLAAAGLHEAQVLVVAVDDRESALKIVRHARLENPGIHIVARARDRADVYELYQAGADDIVRETFDSSVRAGRYVLENAGLTEYEAAKVTQAYYQRDRASIRELAELWVSGQPIHLNEAYIARAKELDTELEAALLDELDEDHPHREPPVGVKVDGG